jgi:hypothetical protein
MFLYWESVYSESVKDYLICEAIDGKESPFVYGHINELIF